VTAGSCHRTPQLLLARCDTPLLLAATGHAIDLAEAHAWSAATLTGVFYGLKTVLDGHSGDGPVLLSQVRQLGPLIGVVKAFHSPHHQRLSDLLHIASLRARERQRYMPPSLRCGTQVRAAARSRHGM
jgi:hypothetical protein